MAGRGSDRVGIALHMQEGTSVYSLGCKYRLLE